ncbi:MAG: hypothetical protein LJE69_09590 [Thiohalocapsa sp.]|uniref:hypothetical protein n=1 Tax=Thiohalocapsa sp. TaxID=2497641 RepID=UPI0025DEC88F|nr:hypothetical protein [Thiohalocapsa sp.]MCG6941489.1 hypothetical protein [Thiohalocapsa sp.]
MLPIFALANAGEALPATEDFAAAKLAVLAASLLSSVAGVAVLWWASGTPCRASPEELT